MTKIKVQNTIMKYDLFGHNEVVIVALSGGYDSMCLLHILHELGYPIQAAHLHHGLREDADEDLDFVRQVTTAMGIVLHEEKQDVRAYATEHKMSLETAGRMLRYDFFRRITKNEDAKIATAHNLNDNAESFIMHLLRGAGSSGLTGIRPYIHIDGLIVTRPLIQVSREEVEQYCKEHRLNPRRDVTNESCDYWRNEIRHKVMPPLIERGGLHAIERACDIISSEDDFLEAYIKALFEEHAEHKDGQIIIRLKWFNEQHIAIRRRLLKRAIISDWKKPVSLLHIDAVIRACEKNYGGKVIQLPGEIDAKIKQGRLFLGGKYDSCD